MKDKEYNFALLTDLEGLLKNRKQTLPKNSYTARLFDAGLNKILDKLGEEITEFMVAAASGNKEQVICEAADALFHLLVLTVFMNLSLEHILMFDSKSVNQSVERLKKTDKDDSGFFYRALGHNLGDAISQSVKYDGSLKQYKKVSDNYGTLFLFILAICGSHGVEYADIESELESRTSSGQRTKRDKNHARRDVH